MSGVEEKERDYIGGEPAGENGEAITACLAAGTYAVRVSAFVSTGATAYLLAYDAAPASCTAGAR